MNNGFSNKHIRVGVGSELLRLFIIEYRYSGS